MIRRFVAISSLLTLTSTAAVSLAQPRPQGELALGVDRVFGYSYSSTSYDDTDVERTSSEFSILGGRRAQSNFNAPRASIDYFVADGVSIGGSLVYASSTETLDIGGTEAEEDSSMLGLAPRVGYATMLSRGFGIWPRGGITFISGEEANVDVSAVALSLEFPLLLAPSDYLAITLGPTLDYALTASAEAAGQDTDLSLTDFGIMAGLVGFL